MIVEADSGYIGSQQGRCYYVSTRTITFSEASPAEIQAFIDYEKKAWYGQEFNARVIDGKTVHIRKGVDSGD